MEYVIWESAEAEGRKAVMTKIVASLLMIGGAVLQVIEISIYGAKLPYHTVGIIGCTISAVSAVVFVVRSAEQRNER